MTPFTLRNDFIRRNAIEAIKSAPLNSRVTIAEPKRSSDQNAKFHAILSDLSKSGLKWAGKERSLDEWKALVVSAHAVATEAPGEVIPGLEGEFVAIRESTARMSVGRTNSLIEYVLAFCATHGIELTDTKRGGFMDEAA